MDRRCHIKHRRAAVRGMAATTSGGPRIERPSGCDFQNALKYQNHFTLVSAQIKILQIHIGFTRRQITVCIYRRTEIGGPNADPEITDSYPFLSPAKQFPEQFILQPFRQTIDQLSTAIGERKSKSVDGLEGRGGIKHNIWIATGRITKIKRFGLSNNTD